MHSFKRTVQFILKLYTPVYHHRSIDREYLDTPKSSLVSLVL